MVLPLKIHIFVANNLVFMNLKFFVMKSGLKRSLLMLMLIFTGITGLYASDGAAIDTGATAWMLTSTALVLLMIPGLAMFYGGLVRSKNVLGTIMHSFVAMGIISVLWVICWLQHVLSEKIFLEDGSDGIRIIFS